MKKVTVFLFSLSVSVVTFSPLRGASIPVGTALVAYSVEPISTHERIGAHVRAALEHDVVVNGKPLLRAGPPVVVVVEGSLRPPRSSGAVSVSLRDVTVNGHAIAVHTTGAYRLPPRFTTKGGVSVSGRETNYPHRTRMLFHLARPLTV